MSHPGPTRRWRTGLRVGLAGTVGLAAVAAWLGRAQIGRWMEIGVALLRDSGAVGALGFVLVYVLATLLFIPGSLLTMAAGVVYGPWLGTLLVSPASVLAAVAAAALGRTIARQWLAEQAGKHPKFRAIDAAIAHDGAKIVFLLRLSPLLPFPLLNYLLGMTRISHGRNAVFSALGMLPGTFAYVYLGAALGSVARVSTGGGGHRAPWTTALLWMGVVATLVLALVLTQLARRALVKALEPAPDRPPVAAPGFDGASP